MGLPPDSIVSMTLARMQQSIERRGSPGDVVQERSGLLFLGNVHDAFPRRLFLDARLSPLDKTAWVMIRLYAQQNEGAVFPTYDELQLQLASPHSEKASRETVSRTLLMLRLTGWLSLCKRVRDDNGRIRGNIYAQHDEPLNCRDAETFDPGWLDLVAASCSHKTKSIRMTALSVLNEILADPSMRHRHSRLSLVEGRLLAPSTPAQMAQSRNVNLPGSETELSKKSLKNNLKLPSSETELSQKNTENKPGSETELSRKSADNTGVRKPNCNVRSFTQSVIKKTYVGDVGGVQTLDLPETFLSGLSVDDRHQLEEQFRSLPDNITRALAGMFREHLSRKALANPVGWMFSMLRRARKGELVMPDSDTARGRLQGETVQRETKNPQVPSPSTELPPLPSRRATREHVQSVIATIRARHG